MKIGQEVVCIRGVINKSTNDKVVEGNVYVIHGLSKCGCSELVDIGFKSTSGTKCPKCNVHLTENIWWLYANRFMPLDDIDISDLEEVLNSKELVIE